MLLEEWGKELAGAGAIIFLFIKRLFTSRLEREIKALREINESNATQLDAIAAFMHKADARHQLTEQKFELVDRRIERLEDRS